MGTSTIYSAVIKPALPALVPPEMPDCCRKEAIARATPQQIPPSTGSFGELASGSTFSGAFFFCTTRTIQSPRASAAKAILHRMAPKVRGGTYSLPTLCATNAVPQMSAANTGNRFCLIFLFMGFIPFCLGPKIRRLPPLFGRSSA